MGMAHKCISTYYLVLCTRTFGNEFNMSLPWPYLIKHALVFNYNIQESRSAYGTAVSRVDIQLN